MLSNILIFNNIDSYKPILPGLYIYKSLKHEADGPDPPNKNRLLFTSQRLVPALGDGGRLFVFISVHSKRSTGLVKIKYRRSTRIEVKSCF